LGRKTAVLLIQKSIANCVVADSEIGSQKLCATNLEIDSQKLCSEVGRRTASLLIQKLVADCVAANSKIGSQLGSYRFKNQQPKIMLLLIQKLLAMVESFWLYFFFCVYSVIYSKSTFVVKMVLSAVNQCLLPKLCCLQRTSVHYRNYVACSELEFAAEIMLFAMN